GQVAVQPGQVGQDDEAHPPVGGAVGQPAAGVAALVGGLGGERPPPGNLIGELAPGGQERGVVADGGRVVGPGGGGDRAALEQVGGPVGLPVRQQARGDPPRL